MEQVSWNWRTAALVVIYNIISELKQKNTSLDKTLKLKQF